MDASQRTEAELHEREGEEDQQATQDEEILSSLSEEAKAFVEKVILDSFGGLDERNSRNKEYVF